MKRIDRWGAQERQLARERDRIAQGFPIHIHGWARQGDRWICVQDYYAEGIEPATGCGSVWESVR